MTSITESTPVFDITKTEDTLDAVAKHMISNFIPRADAPVWSKQTFALYNNQRTFKTAIKQNPGDILFFDPNQATHAIMLNGLKCRWRSYIADIIRAANNKTEAEYFFETGKHFVIWCAYGDGTMSIIVRSTVYSTASTYLAKMRKLNVNDPNTYQFGQNIVLRDKKDQCAFIVEMDKILKKNKFKGTFSIEDISADNDRFLTMAIPSFLIDRPNDDIIPFQVRAVICPEQKKTYGTVPVFKRKY